MGGLCMESDPDMVGMRSCEMSSVVSCNDGSVESYYSSEDIESDAEILNPTARDISASSGNECMLDKETITSECWSTSSAAIMKSFHAFALNAQFIKMCDSETLAFERKVS